MTLATTRDSLSAAQARRIALAAQGLAGARPGLPPTGLALQRGIARLGLLQLDSVSVLVRAHYLPLFSRLGHYDRALLDGLAAHVGEPPHPRRRKLFEYWAHEASLLPVELQPLLRWRMARAAAGEGTWSGIARLAAERPELIEGIYRRVRDEGPLGVSGLEQRQRTGPWWGWSEGKIALEWLFWTGRLTAAGRRGFERVYDLPERVLPPEILARPTPPEHEARCQLLRLASRALGVATEADLRDYFRLPAAGTAAQVAELVESGDLLPVAVEGWRQPAYLARDARLPRRAEATALLAPFDPVVWHRPRAERLFGFTYRLEIYTPAHKRLHGYYVLPLLLGDRLVARVDLKAERALGRLLVRNLTLEPGVDEGRVREAVTGELRLMAAWLGLERIVEGRGGAEVVDPAPAGPRSEDAGAA